MLVIVLSVMNEYANAFCGFGIGPFTPPPPPPTCNCPSGKVAIKRVVNSACQEEKCVSSGLATRYLNQGWIYGCCGVARLGKNQLPDKTSLTAIYPNPVSSSAIISFSLAQSQTVSLKIFDVNGRLISTLADRNFEAGENKLLCNTEQVEAGVYILRMFASQAGREAETESLRFIVAK